MSDDRIREAFYAGWEAALGYDADDTYVRGDAEDCKAQDYVDWVKSEVQRREIWRLWGLLPDGEPSPVKKIARETGLPTSRVATVVYPSEQFGTWADDQEPDL